MKNIKINILNYLNKINVKEYNGFSTSADTSNKRHYTFTLNKNGTELNILVVVDNSNLDDSYLIIDRIRSKDYNPESFKIVYKECSNEFSLFLFKIRSYNNNLEKTKYQILSDELSKFI